MSKEYIEWLKASDVAAKNEVGSQTVGKVEQFAAQPSASGTLANEPISEASCSDKIANDELELPLYSGNEWQEDKDVRNLREEGIKASGRNEDVRRSRWAVGSENYPLKDCLHQPVKVSAPIYIKAEILMMIVRYASRFVFRRTTARTSHTANDSDIWSKDLKINNNFTENDMLTLNSIDSPIFKTSASNSLWPI